MSSVQKKPCVGREPQAGAADVQKLQDVMDQFSLKDPNAGQKDPKANVQAKFLLDDKGLPTSNQREGASIDRTPQGTGAKPKQRQRLKISTTPFSQDLAGKPLQPYQQVMYEATDRDRPTQLPRSPSMSELCDAPFIGWRPPTGPPVYKEPSKSAFTPQSQDSGLEDAVDSSDASSVDALSEKLQSSTFSEWTEDTSQIETLSKDGSLTSGLANTTTGSLQDTRQRRREFRSYLERVKTDFQQRLLRLFMNKKLHGQTKNAMFALFKAHNVHLQIPHHTILHYDCYVNKNDMHSEAFLLSDLENIQCCIGRQILEINNNMSDMIDSDTEISMTIFSKNTPCDPCAKKLILFVDTYNNQSNDKTLPDIKKLTVQYIRHYRCRSNNDKGLQRLVAYGKTGRCQIENRPLDRNEFYAMFVQWVYTREGCQNFCKPCKCDGDTTEDKMYNKILQNSSIKNLTDTQVEQELMSLAIVDTQQKLKRDETDMANFCTFWENSAQY